MLALFSASSSFHLGAALPAPVRAPVVSMQTGAMSDTFIYGPPEPLWTLDTSKMTGKVVRAKRTSRRNARASLIDSLALALLTRSRDRLGQVPTGAVVAAPKKAAAATKKKAPKVLEPSANWNFVYGRISDSSVGPPCGICHHQGSGTGPGMTKPGGSLKAPDAAAELAAVSGNCMGDECQIG